MYSTQFSRTQRNEIARDSLKLETDNRFLQKAESGLKETSLSIVYILVFFLIPQLLLIKQVSHFFQNTEKQRRSEDKCCKQKPFFPAIFNWLNKTNIFFLAFSLHGVKAQPKFCIDCWYIWIAYKSMQNFTLVCVLDHQQTVTKKALTNNICLMFPVLQTFVTNYMKFTFITPEHFRFTLLTSFSGTPLKSAKNSRCSLPVSSSVKASNWGQ